MTKQEATEFAKSTTHEGDVELVGIREFESEYAVCLRKSGRLFLVTESEESAPWTRDRVQELKRSDDHSHYCAFCGQPFERAVFLDEVCGNIWDHVFGACKSCNAAKCSESESPHARAARRPETSWPQHICEECRKVYGCVWCAAFASKGERVCGLDRYECGRCSFYPLGTEAIFETEEQTLTRVIERTTERLFDRQPTLFDLTSESTQTEWNLAHHLANELHETSLLSHFHCDLEVIKGSAGRKRPDIIFHSRGTHGNNFLVVEMKRDADRGELDQDLGKTRSYWFQPPYHYKYGCAVDIRSDRTSSVKVVRNC